MLDVLFLRCYAQCPAAPGHHARFAGNILGGMRLGSRAPRTPAA